MEYLFIVIYKALCFDVAQGRMNGAPNETHGVPLYSHYVSLSLGSTLYGSIFKLNRFVQKSKHLEKIIGELGSRETFGIMQTVE